MLVWLLLAGCVAPDPPPAELLLPGLIELDNLTIGDNGQLLTLRAELSRLQRSLNLFVAVTIGIVIPVGLRAAWRERSWLVVAAVAVCGVVLSALILLAPSKQLATFDRATRQLHFTEHYQLHPLTHEAVIPFEELESIGIIVFNDAYGDGSLNLELIERSGEEWVIQAYVDVEDDRATIVALRDHIARVAEIPTINETR